MNMKPQLLRVRYLLVVLILALTAEGCSVGTSPVSGRSRAYGYSWAQEREIGAQADQQVVAQFGVYEDPQLNAYFQQVAQRVLAESHMRRPDTDPEFRNTPFTFRILDSDVVNAMALPGGYVYITRGLLTHLDNEAQLAMVLGHEIAHVAARHASQQAFSAQLGQLGVLGGAILGQALGLPGGSILDLGGTAFQLLFLKHGRDAEREADHLGAEYNALNRYEIAPAAAFFHSLKRIGEKSGQAIPNWLSTHPDPGEREQTMIELDAKWEAELDLTIVNQDEFLNALNGIIVGKNPRQGFTENGRFYHPDLRFQFGIPNGWQVINQASQVAVIEPNQRAVVLFQFAKGNSAQAAASQFAQTQGVTVTQSGATTVNGKRAYMVEAQLQAEQGTFGSLSYFIEHNGQVYHMLGYTPAETYGQYANAFASAMQSFADLRDSRILNMQPMRLRVQAASQTAPFRNFVTRELPPEWTAEDLAIMNQVQLNQNIPAGTKLKLPAR